MPSDSDPTHSTVGEQNIRERQQRERSGGWRQEKPVLPFERVRVSMREER
jgi:hypothetical protein